MRPVTELRDLLGDRYKATIQAAVLADNPEAITNAQRVGGVLGQLMYLSAVDRLARVLTAVLPDLLAQAWDEGARSASQCASPTGRCARNGWDCDHPNPYRQENNRG